MCQFKLSVFVRHLVGCETRRELSGHYRHKFLPRYHELYSTETSNPLLSVAMISVPCKIYYEFRI